MYLGLDLYYLAFLDLTSCRSTGQAEGVIPWTAIRQWAYEHELDLEQTEDLHYLIPQMDEVYLKFKAKKLSANQPSTPKPKKGR